MTIKDNGNTFTLNWTITPPDTIKPDYFLVMFNCISTNSICSGYQIQVNMDSNESSPKNYWEATKSYLNNKLSGVIWEFSVKAGNKNLGIESAASYKIQSPMIETAPSPAPLVTALPAVMPKDGDSPLPLANCNTGNYFYRLNKGVLERSFFEDKLFVSTDSRPISDFDAIRVKAFQAIKSHNSITTALPVIDFHVSSDFPKVKLAYSKEQLNSTLAYFSDFIPAGSHFQATFITEKDSALISADDISRPDDAQWIIDTFLDPTQAGFLNCGWRYGVSGSHILGPVSKNNGQIGYWMISPTLHGDRYWDPTYLTHEVTHGVQDIIWRKNDISPMEQAGAPYFLIEGGGYLFGIGLSLTNIGWYQDDLFRKIYEYYLGGPELARQKPNSTADILKMIKAAEVNDNDVGQTWAYTIGAQLWEWVIAKYGFDAYWDIVKGLSRTQNYDATVLKVIGKSKEALYAEAAPYILKGFHEAMTKK